MGEDDDEEPQELNRFRRDPPPTQDPPNIQNCQDDDDVDDDSMRIDVILQTDLPDPRGCRGVRHRLCCRAVLPSGIKYNTIEVNIDREKKKIVLTAELIESLKYSDTSMCQIEQFGTNSLTTTYQA